jgi:hypothetical protein
VLNCRGLLQVVTLGKETKINPGMNNCNIFARESFGKGQLKKKSMKNFLHPTRQPKKKFVLWLQCKYNVGFERTLYKQFQLAVPQWK